MKKKSIKIIKKIILLFLFSINAIAQDSLYVDFDHDKIIDSIFYHRDDAVITCKLSSQKFKSIKSKKQAHIGDDPHGINETKNGFEFYNNDMRSGYAAQFEYNKKVEKIQLIGFSVYNYGGASHDGAGQSSINLITHDCEGQWEYYNDKLNLVKTPHLKCKIYLSETFLDEFGEFQIDEYITKVSAFYEKRKKELLKKKKKHIK